MMIPTDSPSGAAVETCPSCGETLEVGSWPFCRSRSNPTGHTSTLELNAQRFDPVVIFKKPDGSFSFPGDSRKPTPQGCERIELRTTREVRAFEHSQAGRDYQAWERNREKDARFFEPLKSNSRADLRQKMRHFSPLGRAFAEAAMRRNDQRPDKRGRYESGFHLEAFN